MAAAPRHQAIAYAFDAQPVFVDTVVRYRRHGDQRVVRFVSKNGVKGVGITLGPWAYHRRVTTTSFVKTVLHADADPDSLALFHVHADHLGSAQVLTKADGTLLSQEAYFAYGRSSDRRDARARYRYIGVERDEDTGLCMTGPRTYDPVVGRFHQPDPVVALAPHGYAAGSPLANRDPNGYQETQAEPDPQASVSIPVRNSLGPTATQVGTLTAARPPPAATDALDAYKAGAYRDKQFDGYTNGMVLDFATGMVRGADSPADTWSSWAGEMVGQVAPFGHGHLTTLKDFANEPGLITGALAAATVIPGVLASTGGTTAFRGSRAVTPAHVVPTRPGQAVAKVGGELANAPYQPLRNADAVISGRNYGGHALDQMQNRGLMPSVVENAIGTGTRTADPIAGRFRYFDEANDITVILEEEANRVITVMPGSR